ncbi:Adipocyte plasma membrane-associated protein-like 2 [Homarus americanus]|uniref:Adipocyte plasma membrane-associated protein-like 2 n=2 Tax=Homarus americanus TaxID=6706 RepID=A0A8J5MU67_HOMAM|nr:Adipocyte plasma membrane-associated protein-like 2 [Homarus americanus]
MRYWLKGTKAGQTEVFVDRLPGIPDNIRDKEDGGYYVSLVIVPTDSSKKISAILARLPLVRKFALRLMAVTQSLFQFFSKIYPEFEQISSKVFHLEPLTGPELVANFSIVVELDADGNIINSLQGNSHKLGLISQTTKVGDYLFFGSPYKKYLGRLFVGPPPVIEVDGKGVKIKTENDTDKNEAEGLEPGVLKNEEDEPQVVENFNKKTVEEAQEGQVEEFVGVKVEENIPEEDEKLVKEKVTVEHTEALETESHKETKDEKEQEPLQQNTEWSDVPEEDIEVKTKENQKDDRDLKKEVGKEEL